MESAEKFATAVNEAKEALDEAIAQDYDPGTIIESVLAACSHVLHHTLRIADDEKLSSLVKREAITALTVLQHCEVSLERNRVGGALFAAMSQHFGLDADGKDGDPFADLGN